MTELERRETEPTMSEHETGEDGGLRRQLGLFQVTMYGVGLILGAGIYVLIGEAASVAGNAVWASFVIGAVIASFTGLSYAELSSMYPKAAAEYVYVRKGFRNNFLAFIVGWLMIFTATVSVATISRGFAGYLSGLSGLPITSSAIILIIALSLVNLYGIRESSWLNVLFTGVEAAGLVLIIYLGFAFGGSIQPNYFESPSGIPGVLAAIPLIFFAYIGFEHIANIAEETKNPTKVLPRAVILSIVITSILYILVATAAVSLLSWQELGESNAPLAEVAGRSLGSAGYGVVSIIALFATTNTVLIALIAGSRILYGMATQQSLPKVLSRVHSRTKTPWVSVLLIMVLASAFALVENIVTVAHMTVFSIVITFSFVNLSLIWLRYREPHAPRKFRVPLSVKGFPIIPFLGFVTTIAGATQFDAYVVSVGAIVIGAGTLFYIIQRERFKHAR